MTQFLISIFASLTLAQTASAAIIENAVYMSADQTLELSLVYSGGEKTHIFSLDWDSCQTVNGVRQIAARLLDTGWEDTGTLEFRQTVSFNLSTLVCRPAELTVFSDKHSRATVWIE